MAKMTFLELAKQILQEAKQPMTYQQIWDMATQKGLTQSLESAGKTPWQTLAAQLYLNIKRQDSIFFIATKRPTTFWLKSRKDELKEDVQELITKEETESLKTPNIKSEICTLCLCIISQMQLNLDCNAKQSTTKKAKNK